MARRVMLAQEGEAVRSNVSSMIVSPIFIRTERALWFLGDERKKKC